MKIFELDASHGRMLDVFSSINFNYLPILQTNEPVKVSFLRLGEQGVIGYHQATMPQFFIVVAGEGYVCGEDRVRVFVQAGQAVFWDTNEWHETTSEKGLTAVVIESLKFDLSHL